MHEQKDRNKRLLYLALDIDNLLAIVYADERFDEEIRTIAAEAKMASFALTEKIWDIHKEMQWRAEMIAMCCGKRNRDLCRGHINVLRKHFMMGGDETERHIDDDNIVIIVSAMYWVKKIRTAVSELMELLRERDAYTYDVLKTANKKLNQVEKEIKRIHNQLGRLAEDIYNKLNRKNAIRFARELKEMAKSIVQ